MGRQPRRPTPQPGRLTPQLVALGSLTVDCGMLVAKLTVVLGMISE